MTAEEKVGYIIMSNAVKEEGRLSIQPALFFYSVAAKRG
jgi:hypothetical protein